MELTQEADVQLLDRLSGALLALLERTFGARVACVRLEPPVVHMESLVFRYEQGPDWQRGDVQIKWVLSPLPPDPDDDPDIPF